MKSFCFGILALLMIIGYHTWEYEIAVEEGRFTYATHEGRYAWPKEPIRDHRPKSYAEARWLLAEGREDEI